MNPVQSKQYSYLFNGPQSNLPAPLKSYNELYMPHHKLTCISTTETLLENYKALFLKEATFNNDLIQKSCFLPSLDQFVEQKLDKLINQLKEYSKKKEISVVKIIESKLNRDGRPVNVSSVGDLFDAYFFPKLCMEIDKQIKRSEQPTTRESTRDELTSIELESNLRTQR